MSEQLNDTPPRFSYESVQRVVETQEENTSALEAKANVVGIGIGRKVTQGVTTNQLCIQVWVTEKKGTKDLDPEDIVPSTLTCQTGDECPTDVLIAGVMEPLGVRDRTRPAFGGHSISPVERAYSGTLGAKVVDLQSDEPALLTNNHVAADESTLPVGHQILQPSLPDGGSEGTDVIATLTRYVNIVFSDTASNKVDAAVCDLTNNTYVGSGLFGAGVLAPTFKTPAIDLFVKKVGRTTDVTFGQVISLNATVLVNYSSGLARFIGQIITTHMSNPGDSGSLIVEADENRPVGLLFAGSDFITVANPIADVAAELDITFSATGQYKQATLAEYRKDHTTQYRLEPVSGIDGWIRTIPDAFNMYSIMNPGFTAQYLFYHSGVDNYVISPISVAALLPQYQNLGVLGYTADTQYVDNTPETVELILLYSYRSRKHKVILGNQPFNNGDNGFVRVISLGYVRLPDGPTSIYPEKLIAEFRRAGVHYYTPDPAITLGDYTRTQPDRFQLYTEPGTGFSPQHLWYSPSSDNFSLSPDNFASILIGYRDLGLVGYTANSADIDPSSETEELLGVFNFVTRHHKLVFASEFTQGQDGYYLGPRLGFVRRKV